MAAVGSKCGQQRCFNCHVVGHTASDCKEAKMLLCYNCHSTGHKTYDCTEIPKCHVCSLPGHVAKHCPARNYDRFARQEFHQVAGVVHAHIVHHHFHLSGHCGSGGCGTGNCGRTPRQRRMPCVEASSPLALVPAGVPVAVAHRVVCMPMSIVDAAATAVIAASKHLVASLQQLRNIQATEEYRHLLETGGGSKYRTSLAQELQRSLALVRESAQYVAPELPPYSFTARDPVGSCMEEVVVATPQLLQRSQSCDEALLCQHCAGTIQCHFVESELCQNPKCEIEEN